MKNFAKCLALLGFLAILLHTGSAASGLGVSGLPNYLVFKEVPVVVEFSVTNDSGADSAFSIEVFSPAKYELIGLVPKFLKNTETQRIQLRLIPESGLENQYYNSKIVLMLGAQRTEKSIEMNFLPAEGCTIDFSASVQKSGKGLALSVYAKNNSVEEKSFALKRLEKLPSDWALENPAQAKLKGLEAKSIDFALSAQSAYKGKGKAIFLCSGKEVGAEFNVDYNGTKSALLGLVAGISGIGGKGMGALALNIALFVVAIILVLAFASRFLKRIRRK